MTPREPECSHDWCSNQGIEETDGVYCRECWDFLRQKINEMQGIVEGQLKTAYIYFCDDCGEGRPAFLRIYPGAELPEGNPCPECGSGSVIMQEIDETPMRLHPNNQGEQN